MSMFLKTRRLCFAAYGLLYKKGVYPLLRAPLHHCLFMSQTGSCVTVKRAHRRSTFSGFFGPPFLFSFTMNFSLQEQRHRRISPSASRHPKNTRLLCTRERSPPPPPTLLRSPDLFGLASVVQREEDICILADAVVSEALQVDEEVVRHGDTAAVTVPLSRAVTLGTGENSDR